MSALPFRLARPRIEYVGGSPHATAIASWTTDATGAATYTDGPVHIRVQVQPAPAAGWRHLDATASIDAPVQLRECALVLEAPAPNPPMFVDRTLRWRALRGDAILNEYTPLAIRWAPEPEGPGYHVQAARGFTAGALAWRTGHLTLMLYFDAAALHPRWRLDHGRRSEAAPLRAAGETFALRLLLGSTDAPALPILGRWPAAAEAAFVITDHCDFDTGETLDVFFNGTVGQHGWRARGLALTKGVFTLPSSPRDRPPAPTLNDPAYRRLVHALHADGSEIAPHALNESGTINVEDFRRGLDRIVADFTPSTWIDHGLSLRYCYTMGGADRGTYDLLGALRTAGFSTLWAYHDVPSEPSAPLDMLALPVHSNGASRRTLLGHLRRGDVLVAAHYARSLILADAADRGTVGLAMGKAFSSLRALAMGARHPDAIGRYLRSAGRELRGLAEVVRDGGAQSPVLPHTRRHLVELAPTVYPERGVPCREARPDELLLFATQEVVHVRDAYTPQTLDELLHTRGLHLGHCYLLNQLPYLAGVFEPGTATPRLSRPWIAFVEALADLVGRGRLWNPVMGRLARWMRAVQLATVVPLDSGGIRLDNLVGEAMPDATLLLPAAIEPETVTWDGGSPTGWRRWPDWLAVWGTLPPNGSAVIRWTAPPMPYG